MKHYPVLIIIALLLAACQPRTAAGTSVPPGVAPPAAASGTESTGQNAGTPPVSATEHIPDQPVIRSSSKKADAVNLVVVRDQPIRNGSVTLDSVTAAQPGWIVIYLDKKGQPGHQIGFAAVGAGKSEQVVVPLDPNTGVDVSPAKLAGGWLFAVLQAGSTAPGTPVLSKGSVGNSVMVRFAVRLG